MIFYPVLIGSQKLNLANHCILLLAIRSLLWCSEQWKSITELHWILFQAYLTSPILLKSPTYDNLPHEYTKMYFPVGITVSSAYSKSNPVGLPTEEKVSTLEKV